MVIIGLFLATLLLFATTAFVGTWLIYRRIRHSRALALVVRETQARVAPWGPARDVAGMRRDVARDADVTSRHLQQAKRAGIAPPDSGQLLASLKSVAASLDAELGLIAREPARRQRDMLPAVRIRVADFQAQTATLRTALAQGFATTRDARMAALADNVQLAWLTADAHQELHQTGYAPHQPRWR